MLPSAVLVADLAMSKRHAVPWRVFLRTQGPDNAHWIQPSGGFTERQTASLVKIDELPRLLYGFEVLNLNNLSRTPSILLHTDFS